MKYFAFSDVHSSYDAMINALDKAGYDMNNSSHKLIFLGDAFDKGKKPVETFLFLKQQIEKDKLIWILGNHDLTLRNSILSRKQADEVKDTMVSICHHYHNSVKKNTNFGYICKILKEIGLLEILLFKTVDYFETEKFVFTHGFIPTLNGKYCESWRKLNSKKWNNSRARNGNGVKNVLVNGIKIPNKTLVCGHVGAYFGRIIVDHPEVDIATSEFNKLLSVYIKNNDNYKTFISDDVINLDANAYRTGFVNVLVIDE